MTLVKTDLGVGGLGGGGGGGGRGVGRDKNPHD